MLSLELGGVKIEAPLTANLGSAEAFLRGPGFRAGPFHARLKDAELVAEPVRTSGSPAAAAAPTRAAVTPAQLPAPAPRRAAAASAEAAAPPSSPRRPPAQTPPAAPRSEQSDEQPLSPPASRRESSTTAGGGASSPHTPSLDALDRTPSEMLHRAAAADDDHALRSVLQPLPPLPREDDLPLPLPRRGVGSDDDGGEPQYQASEAATGTSGEQQEPEMGGGHTDQVAAAQHFAEGGGSSGANEAAEVQQPEQEAQEPAAPRLLREDEAIADRSEVFVPPGPAGGEAASEAVVRVAQERGAGGETAQRGGAVKGGKKDSHNWTNVRCWPFGARKRKEEAVVLRDSHYWTHVRSLLCLLSHYQRMPPASNAAAASGWNAQARRQQECLSC